MRSLYLSDDGATEPMSAQPMYKCAVEEPSLNCLCLPLLRIYRFPAFECGSNVLGKNSL